MSKTIRQPSTTRCATRSARLDGVLRSEARAIIRSTPTRNLRAGSL